MIRPRLLSLPATVASWFRKRHSHCSSEYLYKNEEFSIRLATCENDIEFITRQAIKAGWHIGPYDYKIRFSFDPKSFFIGEVARKPVCAVCAMNYPNHHSYTGANIVSEEHRGKGYGKQLFITSHNVIDQRYTTGAEVYTGPTSVKRWFDAQGYKGYWNTYTALFSTEKIVQIKLSQTSFKSRLVSILPLKLVSFTQLVNYDTFIFGTSRRKLIKMRTRTPGSFTLVALDYDHCKIVGYATLRQIIRGGGTEIGLAMAPLYADNVYIAKALIKKAAEKCLANEAIPVTKLELIHPVGEGCGEGSSELMEELEAKLTHTAIRMYSRGIPPGRKMGKIYGTYSD